MQRCRGPNLQTPEHIEICVQLSTAHWGPSLPALERQILKKVRTSQAWQPYLGKHTAAALALRACLRTYISTRIYTPRPNDTVSVPTCAISCSSSTKKWSMLRRASASVNVATADSGDACASASRQGTRNPRKLLAPVHVGVSGSITALGMRRASASSPSKAARRPQHPLDTNL